MEKEKTIYIEADEEITSLISRIKKTKQPKVSIVVPKGSIILGSIVNLKMLKKHEKTLGKELSIVTTDKVGRHLASQVGFEVRHSLDEQKFEDKKEEKIPVSQAASTGPVIKFKKEPDVKKMPEKEEPEITFKKISEEEEKEESEIHKAVKNPTPKKGLKKGTKRLFLGFGIFSFLVGVLAVLFILPKATIYISPKAEELREDIPLEIKTQDKKADIPGTLIEVTEETSKDFQTTGKKDVGEKAKGTIIVYNEWDSSAQPLVAGTRFVTSDGKIFKTTEAVNVPGTKVEAGKIVAGTSNVNVEAGEQGESYNIGPSNFTIPGLPADKQAKIYGKSSGAMTGGLTKKVNVVSKSDIEEAKANLSDDLKNKAKDDLNKKVVGKKILEAAIQEEVVEEKPSLSEGQEGDKFTLTSKKNFWTVAFSEAEAKKVISSKIKETLSQDKEIVEDKLENIEYKIVSVAKDNLNLSVSVTAFATKKLELTKAKLDLPGKSKEEALEYFRQNNEITDTKVEFWPFWVSKVPLNRSRIEIKINIPGK